MTCLDRFSIDATELMATFPPRLRDPKKRLVLAHVCPPDRPSTGTIELARFAPLELPTHRGGVLHPCTITALPEIYDYAAATGNVWHVNFADPQLFVAYGSPLLAQDELQVLEHPALGSLREAVLARNDGASAYTEHAGSPTPILIRNVERHCAFDTAPAFEPGRERGLYGNRFADASEAAILSALRLLDPRPRTNLIAIAAPTGRGRYTLDHLEFILETALTAFTAAVDETPGLPVEIRTGFWGCGAFGGNRVLMTLLQLLAARMAGVTRLTFYTFDQAGVVPFEQGERALSSVLRGGTEGEPIDALLERIHELGYEWGVSDGT